MLEFDTAGFVAALIDLCLTLRPFSILFLIAGVLLLAPVLTVGMDKLRQKSGGPLGEVLGILGLAMQAVTLALWWGPALLR